MQISFISTFTTPAQLLFIIVSEYTCCLLSCGYSWHDFRRVLWALKVSAFIMKINSAHEKFHQDSAWSQWLALQKFLFSFKQITKFLKWLIISTEKCIMNWFILTLCTIIEKLDKCIKSWCSICLAYMKDVLTTAALCTMM